MISEKFFNHYEANGWYRGKTKIRNWKACVKTWINNDKPKKKSWLNDRKEVIDVNNNTGRNLDKDEDIKKLYQDPSSEDLKKINDLVQGVVKRCEA